jgi:multicomponent Na+:H+ antiporter subunit F
VIPFFQVAGTLVLLLTIPFIYRAIRGPTLFDRVVALNGMGTLVPVLMILVGLMYDRVSMFVDVAIALFLLNLFTTLLIGRYVRDKAEQADRTEGRAR